MKKEINSLQFTNRYLSLHPHLKPRCTGYCGVEQLVARRAHNPKAVGSSPTPATLKRIKKLVLFFYCMFYTYVLYSDLANKIYIGFTADLEN